MLAIMLEMILVKDLAAFVLSICQRLNFKVLY